MAYRKGLKKMGAQLLGYLEKLGTIVATFGIATILEQWTGLLEALLTAPTSIKIVLVFIGCIVAAFAQIQQQKQTHKETIQRQQAQK